MLSTPYCTRDEEGAQRLINVQTEVTSPPVSTRLQHRRFPLFPQLTHSWMLTTGVLTTNTSTAVGCCLEYSLHRTKKHGGREHKHTCCLECCHGDDPRTRSQKKAIKPRSTIDILRSSNQRRSPRLPDCLRRYTHGATTSLRIAGVRSP